MFDPDSLETFIDGRLQESSRATVARDEGAAARAGVGAGADAGGDVDVGARGPQATPDAPKSREQRLREFYEKRQPPASQSRELAPASSALSGPRQPSDEDQAEALDLRKRGNDLYEAQDYEAAVEHYTTAIKTAPSAVLHSNRAAAYMMLGWWDQAHRDTRAAIRKDPGNDRALERHGRVLLALDQPDAALNVAADLAERLPEEQAKAIPASIRRLRWLAVHARSPETLEECREVLAEFGTKAELASPLGRRLRRTLARVLVGRSDAVDNQRKIRPALARNRRCDKDTDEIQEITPLAEEALRITAKLLEDDPEDADARYWRGRALARLGRPAEADQQLQRGLRDEPEHQQMKELVQTMNSLEDFKFRGNTFYKDGKLNEAIHLYTEGLENDPGCVDTRICATLYFNRSAAYRRKGDFEQALDDANMALALNPKWCKALYRRGILLLECGRYAEALTELKVVQRADPTFDDDLEVWLRRAHHWMAKSRGEVNYYRFMRLPMDATKDEIRKQYHRLCLLWHPDKSNTTEENGQRFEELQQAYKFLMDDGRREKYDFGIWKDKTVRHHVKRREKVKDSWDDSINEEDLATPYWYDDQLLDPKVESIYWGDGGPPAWLEEKRKKAGQMKMYGEEA